MGFKGRNHVALWLQGEPAPRILVYFLDGSFHESCGFELVASETAVSEQVVAWVLQRRNACSHWFGQIQIADDMKLLGNNKRLRSWTHLLLINWRGIYFEWRAY